MSTVELERHPAMNELARLLEEAETRPLQGWDISYDGRISSKSPGTLP